jgi:hypothetical protein
MDSGVLGMGAVAWTEAWNSAAPESGLRLPVDPARLLELLRGMPVSRALLADLQRAASAGHSVDLIVSPDHQIAEISTGSGHYVLTQAARNTVLAALVARPPSEAGSTRPAPVAGDGRSAPMPEGSAPSRRPPASGVLWESPSASVRDRAPSESIALPWLGPAAHLEVGPDGSGTTSESAGQEPAMRCARLHLELPHLGRFDADIRVCGSTVAVLVGCADPGAVQPRLGELQRALSAQGLVSAHVGMEPSRGP